MVIIVNFNPAIDCTAHIDTFIAGGLNRIQDVRQDAGGKGINVAKTLKALGMDAILCGFMGSNYQIFEQCFRDWNIRHDFVKVDGLNRSNLKIMSKDGSLTEVNEPSFEVSKEKRDELLHKVLSYVDDHAVVVLSGSLPKNVKSDFVVEIIKECKQLGAKVILDGDGEVLQKGILCHPTLIKPNEDELQRYFKVEHALTQEKIILYAKKLVNQGVEMVCVSCGKDGAICMSQDECYQSSSLNVDVKSTVGAGDAMVASFAYGLEKKMAMKEMFELAVACSTAEIMQEGTQPGPLELVLELKKNVVADKCK